MCLYIDDALKKFCKAHRVKYVRMSRCDSAVCRGALINAMNESFFGWRLSRAFFGIVVREDGRTHIKWFIVRVRLKSLLLDLTNICRASIST